MAADPTDPTDLTERTRAHYRDRFERFGETPAGVDWNGVETQTLHFEQLLRLPAAGERFSLNDFGCGYGALAGFVVDRFPDARYRGYDLNDAMIAAARRRYAAYPNVGFDVADRPRDEADYTVASGVFTLRLDRSDAECRADLVDALDGLDAVSRRGFGFNCLTSYSDPDRMRDDLYYPDPCDVFDACKRRYARDVALLHDYGLYAFTILVRKTRPGAA